MSNQEYLPSPRRIVESLEIHDLPQASKSGLEPMPVDDNVITIANLMKPEAERKLKTKFTTYDPLYYILKEGINFCIRVSQCYESQAKINLFVFLV